MTGRASGAPPRRLARRPGRLRDGRGFAQADALRDSGAGLEHKLEIVHQLLSDTRLAGHSEARQAFLAYYGALSLMAERDVDLAKELEPVFTFIANRRVRPNRRAVRPRADRGKILAKEDELDPIPVALAIGEALDSLGVPYFLGGSLASGLQGEPRATTGIDVVVELRESQVSAFAKQLGPNFSADEEGLRAAIRARRSDNILFLPLVTRVDLFVCGLSPFDLSEMSRRRRVEVRPGRHLWIKSAEDTVLRKLLWFRQGGESSEKQWRDITSVLRVAGGSLDIAYLDEWAGQLGVEDLLARARAEAERE